MTSLDTQPLTAAEHTLLTAARIVDAYQERPVPWIHRAVLAMAAHMLRRENRR